MIILNQVYGQLCNQLFLFSHLIAYSLETGNRVWFPGFFRQEKHFPAFSDKNHGSVKRVVVNGWFHFHEERIYKLFRRFLHADSKILRYAGRLSRRRLQTALDPLRDVCFPEFGDPHLPRPLCFFEGWMFRVPRAFRLHQDQIRSAFAFEDGLRVLAERWLDSLGSLKVIGVHIRLGDYETAAPQWAYPLEDYLRWMRQIQITSGEECAFVVVSDVAIPDFHERYVYHYRGSAVEDLCILSLCDCVMGPPSTFNRWAAFMGNKKHLCIWTKDQEVQFSGFQKFSMTEGGKELTEGEVEAVKWFGIA
jgi:hypothetical protein